MSVLNFKPIFEDTSSFIKNEPFSAMYFGRHCGKNLLILKHDITLLLVFGDDCKWSCPEFIKSASFPGDRKKGTRIVGNEDVVLLLDTDGELWKLINGFQVSDEGNECLFSLEKKYFYQWVPFKKFQFAKILAVTAFRCGFACIGLNRNWERKLVVLPSVDSALEDYTFDGLSTTTSFSYYLTNLNINTQNCVYKGTLSPAEEILLVGNRSTGRLYLCSKFGSKTLVNQSDIYLISVLHFEKEKCLLFCFESGKLSFNFYTESRSSHVVYLSKKIICVERCCCVHSCLLWSDGVELRHTKLVFQGGDNPVKVTHLRLNCAVVCPVSFLNVSRNALAVTANRIYYCITPGVNDAVEIRNNAEEILSEIYKGSITIGELHKKIDALTYYLNCKEMIQNDKIKVDISLQGNKLLLKGRCGNFLRDFWKIKLATSTRGKIVARMFDLENDLREGMLIAIENPFKNKIKVSFFGDFLGNNLFVDLGEVGETETDLGTLRLSKQLKEMLAKRNPYIKENLKVENK